MKTPTPHLIRAQSHEEEIANGISHGLGLIMTLAAVPYLITRAAGTGDAQVLFSVSLFAGTMTLMYLSSTIYHFLKDGRAKELFLKFDYIAIYLLIAGTYSPFTAGLLKGTLGWTIFTLSWGLGCIGILAELLPKKRNRPLALTIYVVMGWMIVPFIVPLYYKLHLGGMLWLAAGGIFYTLGIYFFLATSRFCHFIWHVFTMAGTVCHYVAVLNYIA